MFNLGQKSLAVTCGRISSVVTAIIGLFGGIPAQLRKILAMFFKSALYESHTELLRLYGPGYGVALVTISAPCYYNYTKRRSI